jgi:hypothetical protein
MLLEETLSRSRAVACFPSIIYESKEDCYIWTKNERWASSIGKKTVKNQPEVK